MKIDFSKVYEKAEEYKPAISRFLRDMIAIPSESRQEAQVIQRIKAEMETILFNKEQMPHLYLKPMVYLVEITR